MKKHFRKLLSAILASLILVTALMPAASAQSAGDEAAGQAAYGAGDVDGDGTVTTKDVLEIQKHLASVVVLNTQQLSAADVTGDGKVGVSDALRIQQYLAKMIGSLEPERKITRGEWADMLVSSCGLPAANTQDDVYTDITGSIYYESVRSLYACGALPADLAAEFSPESVVSREFAAYTIVHALGYQPEGYTLSCIDADSVRYQQEAYVVLSLGFLSLENGSFLPKKELTFVQEKQIAEKLRTYKAGEKIDPDHKNSVEYAPGVRKLDNGVAVEESGTTVTLSGSGVPALKSGDVFVTEQAAYKAVNVSVSGGKTVVKTSQPLLHEVAGHIDVETTAYGDVSKIEKIENAVILQTASNKKAAKAINHKDSWTEDIEQKIEIKLPKVDIGGGLLLQMKGTVDVPKVNWKFEGDLQNDPIDIEELLLTVESSSKVEYVLESADGAAKERKLEKPLFRIPVPLGWGFTADLEVGIKITAEGKATLTAKFDGEEGIRIVNNMPSVIYRQTGGMSAEIKASVKMGTTVSPIVSFLRLGDLADISLFVGPAAHLKMEASQEINGRVLVCGEGAVFGFVEFTAGTKSLLKYLKLTYKLTLFNEKNSFWRMSSHWENGSFVPKCTKDDEPQAEPIAPIPPAAEPVPALSKAAMVAPYELDYKIYDDGVSVYDYGGTKNNIIIPDFIDGQPVTRVTMQNKNVLGITLPLYCAELMDTINGTSIVSIAFAEGTKTIRADVLSSLAGQQARRIIIPDTVVEIEDEAFSHTDINEIVLPDSVKIIGKDAFRNCIYLKNVRLPQGITEIPDGMFFNTGLEKFTVPQSVQKIGSLAFSGSYLKEISLPQGLREIGEQAFLGNQLEEVTVPSGVMFNGGGQFGANKFLERVVFEDGVDTIPDSCFYGCEALKELTLPGSIKEIGDSAFGGCLSLERVSFSEGLERLGSGAFASSGLSNLLLPESLREIGFSAFSGCYNLQSASLPDGLTQLGAYAFSDCENLRDVNIPRGISTIPQFAFKDTGLDRITIPGTVNTIESWAFVFCESLRHLTIENGVKRIEGAFSGTPLTVVTIPESVQWVGSGAFSCKSLDTVAFLSDSALIEEYAFENASETVFYGHKNSTAQAYAKRFGYPFVELES